MWYWIHNGSIDAATGNFNARDDFGPVTLWALSESMLIRTWISPPSQTLSVPSTWILTSTQDTNNGLFTTGGVSGNALKLTQVATPIAAVGTASTSGGTLSAGNYYVKVVGIDVNGNPTAPSVESSVITTTGTTSSIAYIIPATPGVNSYQIYVTQTSGVYTSGYFTYSPDYLTNYFTLTTLSGTTAGTIPSTNLTGGIVAAGNVSTTGNIAGGNLLTGGLISATGNITGNYIFGNGSLLTGVVTSVANISNGTSNVTVVSSDGNITVGVSGVGNVAVFAPTGEYVTGLISASGNIISNSNIAAGNLSTSGNIVGGGVRSTSSGTAPSNPAVGDFWYNTTTNVQFRFTFDGTSYYWVDDYGPTNSNAAVSFTNLTVSGVINSGIIGTSNYITVSAIIGANINALSFNSVKIAVGGSVFVPVGSTYKVALF